MRIRIVDAFTERPFAGNPAGVVLLDSDSFPEDAWLQRVAAEVNLSETAFAHPLPPGGDADWALRWLTPATEVNMCGHATLATAHVLHITGTATGTVRFRTRSGVLITTAEGSGSITMDFPTAPLAPVDVPEAVTRALGGVEIRSAHTTGPNVGDLLVELPDEKTVRGLAPDFRLLAGQGSRGVIATARAEDADGDYDFVSRGFFPGVGIDEDPVTGSAHTALAPFWSARLGRDTLVGHQGGARTGRVRTVLRGDRTLLTGSAVTVIDGELLATA
ncbi:oxidoreductase [Streptomyces sp. NRRL F-4489]|uniref:PhzF family phenazine biosynthesis protein n=1 Tax=Streptomyces sp. NRRL F-4489 TaxID=1609095 RepID=UPI0007463DED|nr:PhzF family phenazine biosynthesis protein [Streptomyces sp. NRRL F-4489]KUL33502.1 oxidoreductase [Streptomyces sp. NRRL F-4489]